MTKVTLVKAFALGLAPSFRGFVHFGHGGSMVAGGCWRNS